jgi:hypothetical protein
MAILSCSLPRRSPRLITPPPDIPLLFHPQQQIAWVPHCSLTLFVPLKKPRPLCQARSPTTISTTLPLHLIDRVAAPNELQSNMSKPRGSPLKNTKGSSEKPEFAPPPPSRRIHLFLQHKLPFHPDLLILILTSTHNKVVLTPAAAFLRRGGMGMVPLPSSTPHRQIHPRTHTTHPS